MKRLSVYILSIVAFLSCKENNCVRTTDIAFEDLNEPNIEMYEYESDSLYLSIPTAVTPNNDGVNDEFVIETNILEKHYVSTEFKVANGCEDVVHKENGTFPFTFPEIASLEDGQYNFNYSLVLENNKLLTGGGIIRVVRK